MEKKFSILCVEDDNIARMSICLLLEDYANELYCAEDGEEAYKLFLKYNPDVVLTDLNLPKMHGLELIKKIKEIDFNKPVIVFSAFSDRDTLLNVLNHGVDGFVPKPINFDEIIKALNRALDRIDDLKDEKYKDILTKAYNRKYLKEIKLDDGFLVFLDMDNFKKVNDTYGHDIGDEVLINFVKDLENLLEDDELLIRYGGDEFVIVLKRDEDEIENTIKEILNKCNRVIGEVEIGCSMGVVRIDKNKDIKELIAMADKAMYEVKKSTKNGYSIIY